MTTSTTKKIDLKGKVFPSARTFNLPDSSKFSVKVNSFSGEKLDDRAIPIFENFWTGVAQCLLNLYAVKSLEFSLDLQAEITRQHKWVEEIKAGDAEIIFHRILKESAVHWKIDGKSALDFLNALQYVGVTATDEEVKPLF